MTATPDDRLGSHWLQVRVVQAAERMKDDFAAAAEELGLNVPEARALLLLEEPLAMGVLAQRLTCDQSYVTRIADDLEAHGLAERAPGEDRRIQLLTITRKGERMRDRLVTAVSVGSLVLNRLDDRERATLRTLLDQLLRDS